MNNHMNQKGFINILLIVLVVVLAGVAGYFTLSNRSIAPTPTPLVGEQPTPSPSPTPTTPPKPTPTSTQTTPKTSDSNSPCQSSRFCKDSSFVSSGYGWETGCVNVLLTGGTGREQARLLLQQLNLKEPAALSEGVKPYGAFVPTLEVIVGDFNQTVALLKKDSRIIDVRLNYHSINPSTDPNASYFVYVLFADSMTPSQGYKLLTDTYKLRVNGNINSIISDGVPLRLEVSPGSENSTVGALRMSSVVQYAIQCPVQPPASAN